MRFAHQFWGKCYYTQLPAALQQNIQYNYFDKVNLIEEVKGQYLESYSSDSWYRILWHENGELKSEIGRAHV